MFFQIFFKKLILFLFLVTILNQCSAQKKNIEQVKHLVDIPIEATQIEIDDLGNIYVLSSYNSIIKYSIVGEKLYEYSPLQLGDIQKIDVSNPHKILVYFPDFQMVQFLDNTLSEISNFTLENISQDITLIAMSNNNEVWIYDAVDSRIKKTKQNGEITISSIPISEMVGATFHPQFMKEDDNEVFIYDPNFGLLKFDFHGHFIGIEPQKDLTIADVQLKTIITVAENKISTIKFGDDMIVSDPTIIKLPYQPIDIKPFQNNWFVLTEKGIVILKE